jgi:hypothetical protein
MVLQGCKLRGVICSKDTYTAGVGTCVREYSTVRAICLSLWKLLLRDQSGAGREILSILQDEPRSTNLAGKSSENILRIPVPGGYLNTILSILCMVSTIR